MAVVLTVAFIAYLPSLQNGYVNWDDQVNVYKNPHITKLSDWESFPTSVQGIFTTDVMGNYNPLPIFTFAIEKLIFGLESPGWFHLNNILLHLICTVLVFRIALALNLEFLPAAFCALIFAIQPMRVESVAWISERKDVLMGTFYFLALYLYIKVVKQSLPKRGMLIILISFLLALLSKIQAVALPLAMLLVDYYFDREISVRLIFEKWLFFLLSLITGLVGLYFLKVDGGLGSNTFFSFSERLFIGAYSYVVYIVKSLVPYRLVPVYPYPSSLSWLFYASVVPVLIILALVAYSYIKGKKTFVFGVLFFTFNIMFVLQILGAGQGFIADRFTYVAYFGLFFIYAYLLQRALAKYLQYRMTIYAAIALLIVVYGTMTFQQNRIWKNGETLWTHVLTYYPETSLAWENRAGYYADERLTEEALRDYAMAMTLQPNKADLYYSRANVYYNADQPGLAVQDYSRAIQLAPGTSEYLLKRGITYFELNEFGKALQDLNVSEKLDPLNIYLYSYRARIFLHRKKYGRAQSDLERYLSMNPDNPAMWSNLGNVARMNKRFAKSLEAYNVAIQLDPDKLDYYYKRAATYYEMGDVASARKDLNYLRSKGFKNIHPTFESLLHQAGKK